MPNIQIKTAKESKQPKVDKNTTKKNKWTFTKPHYKIKTFNFRLRQHK